MTKTRALSLRCDSIEFAVMPGRKLSDRNVDYTVEWIPHMETIQVVLDKRLLQATDRAARQTKRNRSALVRDALREHIRRLEIRTLEERDREGYSRQPGKPDESLTWEAEAVWPAE